MAELLKADISPLSLRDDVPERIPWFKVVPKRDQGAILYSMHNDPGGVCEDISASISRVPGGEDHISSPTSTLSTHSRHWRQRINRTLTGWEACLLQCIPINAIPGAAQFNRGSIVTLSGDAFNGACICAVFVGILTHLPSSIGTSSAEPLVAGALVSLIYVNA